MSRPKQPRPKINKKIRKDEPKVADKFDIEDLGDKVSLCRCWKSAKVSDASHSNTWPIIINPSRGVCQERWSAQILRISGRSEL